MIWFSKPTEDKSVNREKWHEWFAWFPVRLTDKPHIKVWLQKVKRKGTEHHRGYSYAYWSYEYVLDDVEKLLQV